MSANKKLSRQLSKFEKALEQLYAGRYRQAQTALTQLESKSVDNPVLLAQIRLFLKICRNGLRGDPVLKEFEDFYSRGVVLHNQGNYKQALETLRQGLKKSKSEETDPVHLALAATHAKLGETQEALHHLKKSIELNARNRLNATYDSDFKSLHNNNEFKALLND